MRSTSLLAASFLVALPGIALADDAAPEPPRPPMTWQAGPAAEAHPEPGATPGARAYAEERPFVHLLDPTTPAAGQLGLEYGLGGASGTSADRSLPTAVISSGLAHSLGVTYGATDRLAPFVVGRVLQEPGTDGATAWSGAAGARFQITRPGAPLKLALAGAVLRDWGGNAGAYARLASSWDVSRLRLAANVHAEHAFAKGRDKVDVIVMAGASWRAVDILRLGVEYVGQDLEEAFGDEDDGKAEGGARHYAGPTASLDLLGGRMQVVGGPAFGLSERTPGLLGRLAVVGGF